MDSNDDGPVFPLEIFARVLNCLGADRDLETLRACAIVCCSFLSLCQPHLFAIVEINEAHPLNPPHVEPITAKRFADTLLRAPHLAPLIKTLKYCIIPSDFDVSNLTQALEQLALVEAVCVSFHAQFTVPQDGDVAEAFNRTTMDWQTSPLRSAFAFLLGRPTLRLLCLGWQTHNFQIEDLGQTSTLKTLILNAQIALPLNYPSMSCRPIYLEQLVIFIGCRSVLQVLRACQSNGTRIFDITNLRTLSLPFDHEGEDEELNLIHYAAAEAKNLSQIQLIIAPRSTCAGLYGQILPHKTFQTLTTIHIILSQITTSATIADPYAGLCDELRKIAGKNCIEDLRVSIRFRSNFDEATEDALANLDKSLAGSGWPYLKRVHLSFWIHGWNASDRKVLPKKIYQSQFPLLSSSPDVAFECDSDLERYRLWG